MTKQEIKQQIQKLVEKYQRIAEAGKIKLIYIDPLYNTGNDEDAFTYNNNFKH